MLTANWKRDAASQGGYVNCLGAALYCSRWRHTATDRTVFWYVEYDCGVYWSSWCVPGTMNCEDF